MRRWLGWIAAIGIIAGVLLYGFRCYQVIQAGGLRQPLSIPSSCNQEATGSPNVAYRPGERVHIERVYLPPRATCVWTDGSRVDVVSANALSWGGPVLIVVGALGAVGRRVALAAEPAQRDHGQ